MGSLWSVLESIFRDASNAPAGTEARTAAMLRGACQYLEAGHAQHVQEIISVSRSQVRLCTHAPAMKLSTACKQPTLDPRSQADLGGTPSRKAQVHAFLRLREKDSGSLDLDMPGGFDTTGHRVFFCLRSGFYQEAVEVCRALLSGAAEGAGTCWTADRLSLHCPGSEAGQGCAHSPGQQGLCPVPAGLGPAQWAAAPACQSSAG